jgi:hypothetical protein
MENNVIMVRGFRGSNCNPTQKKDVEGNKLWRQTLLFSLQAACGEPNSMNG